MKHKLGEFLSSFDHFGVLSQVSFFNNDSKFKSLYGGVLSILIMSLSFGYFCYLMFMWRTQQLLPTVTNQQIYVPELRFFNLKDPLFVFQLEIDEIGDTFTNIQNKNGRIYDLSVNSSYVNYKQVEPNPTGYKCNQAYYKYDYFDPICLNLNDQYQTNYAQNFQNRSQDVYVDYTVLQCDPETNTNCLSLEDQTTVFGFVYSYWRLTLITQDVNIQTGEIVNIPQDYYFDTYDYLKNYTSWNLQLIIKKATYIIDTGIFFSSEQKIEIVRSIQLIQTGVAEQKDLVTKVPKIAYIFTSLSRQEEIIRVIYPKLGQVLADLGAIIQILLSLGILMNRFNTSQMAQKVEEALLQIYFPNIKIYKFRYDWKGKIKQIFFGGRLLKDRDFEEAKQFREISGEQVKSKLNYMNILDEISKLQINLQMRTPRDKIVELQDLGYRVRQPSSFPINNDKEIILDYEDFILINTKTKKSANKRFSSFGDQLLFINQQQSKQQSPSPMIFLSDNPPLSE